MENPIPSLGYRRRYMAQMRFTIRTSAIAFLVIAIALGVWVALDRNWRNSGFVPRKHWPEELRTIVDRNSISEKEIAIRHGDRILSSVWKIPATESILADYIELFELTEVSNTGIQLELIRSSFPYAWQWPQEDGLVCYANPTGTRFVSDGETIVALVHDATNNRLLCYNYFNF